jgi:hypothetical protein
MAGLTSILDAENPHRAALLIHQNVSEKLTIWSARTDGAQRNAKPDGLVLRLNRMV